MSRHPNKTLSIAGLVSILLAGANTPEPLSDWRLLGGTADEYVLYEAKGVRRLPDGHLEMWLKALPMKDMDEQANKPADKARIDRIAAKIVRGYGRRSRSHRSLRSTSFFVSVLREDIAKRGEHQPYGARTG